jgi:hypothetical protein
MMVSRRSTLLLALLCACSDTTANDADREPGLAEIDSSTSRIEEVAISPGLAQRVRLTPAEPTPGSLFRVQSTIVNRSSNDIVLESRICGLTLGGTLRLEHPEGFGVCGGYSMTGPLAPGDSVRSTELRQVASSPGRYLLTVSHALDPSASVQLFVTVR